ncbi:hypothetical protein F7Q99_16375 [Streptomyces kaniharaensis]|uniref:DUF4352 domain-containing protein n=1 Tax=Streptomyces kaniharaensis TaxID=212423 RepID=A0A6N7KQE6_9ACTN|nr:hypothetical protein [Streptomyces kaniharaensis]MQS13802.1 hypothetical protein [Streptomyces kaniharaensis]
MTKTRPLGKIARAGVPAAALALLLAACGPDNSDPVAASTDTPAAPPVTAPAAAPAGTPTGAAPPASRAPAPGGSSAPAAGGSNAPAAGGDAPQPVATAGGNNVTQISYDRPLPLGATGRYLGKSSTVDATAVSITKGTAAEIAPFAFMPDLTNGKTPYYVTMTFTNRTGTPLAQDAYMMRAWVKPRDHSAGTLPAPTLQRSIPQCDTKSLVPLADGQSVKLCAVYLVPNDNPPAFLTYGNILDTAPLVWKVG